MTRKSLRLFLIITALILVFLTGLFFLGLNQDIAITPASIIFGGSHKNWTALESKAYLISFGSVFLLFFLAWLYYLKFEE